MHEFLIKSREHLNPYHTYSAEVPPEAPFKQIAEAGHCEEEHPSIKFTGRVPLPNEGEDRERFKNSVLRSLRIQLKTREEKFEEKKLHVMLEYAPAPAPRKVPIDLISTTTIDPRAIGYVRITIRGPREYLKENETPLGITWETGKHYTEAPTYPLSAHTALGKLLPSLRVLTTSRTLKSPGNMKFNPIAIQDAQEKGPEYHRSTHYFYGEIPAYTPDKRLKELLDLHKKTFELTGTGVEIARGSRFDWLRLRRRHYVRLAVTGPKPDRTITTHRDEWVKPVRRKLH